MATQIGDDEVLEQRYPANAQDPMELMADVTWSEVERAVDTAREVLHTMEQRSLNRQLRGGLPGPWSADLECPSTMRAWFLAAAATYTSGSASPSATRKERPAALAWTDFPFFLGRPSPTSE